MNRRLICILLMLSGFSAAFGLESGDDQTRKADREEYPFVNTTIVPGYDLPPTEHIMVDGQPVRLEHGLKLVGKDLSGIRINNRTLVDVDLSGSDLHNADFEQTRFLNCSFRNVNFKGVKTLDATFEGCDFTDVWFEDTSLNLTREQFLSSRNLKEDRALSYFCVDDYPAGYTNNIDYSGFCFNRVTGIDAKGGTFTDACFLRHCSLYNATKDQLISTWNYKNRNLDSISLQGPKDKMASLSGLDLSNFRIEDLSFWDYDVSGVNFCDAIIWEMLQFFCCSGATKEQLQSTWNWKNRRFDFSFVSTEVDWSNTDFSGFTFCHGSSLCGNVAGADFTDAKFLANHRPNEPSSIIRTLEHCQDLTIEQVKSTWNYKMGKMEGVVLPEEVQHQLDAEKTTAAPE